MQGTSYHSNLNIWVDMTRHSSPNYTSEIDVYKSLKKLRVETWLVAGLSRLPFGEREGLVLAQGPGKVALSTDTQNSCVFMYIKYININKAFSYYISTFAQEVLPRQPRVGVVVLLLLRAQHLLQEPLLLLAPNLGQDNVSTQRLAVPIGMAPKL